MNIALPRSIYIFFFLPLVVAFLGWTFWRVAALVPAVLRGEQMAVRQALDGALFLGMLVGTVGASLIASQFGLEQAQGRYIFVVIPFAVRVLAVLVAGAGKGAAYVVVQSV